MNLRRTQRRRGVHLDQYRECLALVLIVEKRRKIDHIQHYLGSSSRFAIQRQGILETALICHFLVEINLLEIPIFMIQYYIVTIIDEFTFTDEIRFIGFNILPRKVQGEIGARRENVAKLDIVNFVHNHFKLIPLVQRRCSLTEPAAINHELQNVMPESVFHALFSLDIFSCILKHRRVKLIRGLVIEKIHKSSDFIRFDALSKLFHADIPRFVGRVRGMSRVLVFVCAAPLHKK